LFYIKGFFQINFILEVIFNERVQLPSLSPPLEEII
jgi:hypothetical protein